MKKDYLSNRLVYFLVLISCFLLINLLMIGISFGTEIKLSYATPKDEPSGLAWDGEYLWLAHDQDYGEKGLIVKMNPYNGHILDSIPSPGTEPMGLAWGDNYLWIVDLQDNKYKIFKIDPNENGKVIDYFSLDSGGLFDIERPTGLAYSGNHLWVIDETENKIYNIDLIKKTLFSINSPTDDPGDLAWDGNNLYVADTYGTEIIYKVNPLNGEVLEKIDLPGEDPHVFGLTWDGMYLWMVDDYHEIIYQLDVDSLTFLHSDKFKVINTYSTSETSPLIKLKDIELMDISNGTYYIEGSALDADGIKYILINGKPVAGSNQFGTVITNVEGDFISIEVGDNSGNLTLEKILLNKSNISPTLEPDDSSSDTTFGAIISALGVIIAAIIGYFAIRRYKE